MLRIIYFFLIWVIFFQFKFVYALQSDWSNGIEAKIRIISPLTHNNNHSLLYLGLEYQLQDGWKTYWKSPGEGGFPQELDWSKSTNVSNIEILWPTPVEFEILDIKSLGYQEEVIFPLKIFLKNIHKDTFLSFNINFLTCKDICIPGKADLELTLPAGTGQLTNHSFYLEKSLSSVPVLNKKIKGLEIIDTEGSVNNKHVFINIEAISDSIFEDPKLYLDSNLGLPLVESYYTYSLDRKNVKVLFVFNKSLFKKDKIDLSVLLKDKKIAIEHKTIIKLKKVSDSLNFQQSFYYILFISLIGGIILNVMPCVLPVLSIKLLSILNDESSLKITRKSFLTTALGIIFSFLLLSITLLSLRYVGISIGWGIQFQQPLFLMVIALVLFLFALNLLGFFEILLPNLVTNIFSSNNNTNLLYKDFFNGFFATLLATPCSAPFVGTAITAAFTQTPFVMISIFLSMGLGMASPYILVSIFPKLVKFLPKPGSWMNAVKFILGLLLLGTLVWIGFILQNHFNYLFIVICAVLALLLTISIKIFFKEKLLIIIFFIIIFFSLPFFSFLKANQPIVETDWIDITTVKLEDLLVNNDIFFVDITADWCATCQFNKLNVINSSIIQETFEHNNIIKLRGDWTKPNKQIESFLQQHNRFGIPFNIMYSKYYPKGIILSELLTSTEIIKTIDQLQQENK